MPKLSLIIPVYNVEKYLRECLDSCINQTLKDIEIICINDCSPDDSYKILEEYSKKDNRVKIINHEENKGLGAARNTGIANATGEYIWFIDSDDFIDSISCQVLYDCAKEHDVDVLLFQGKTFIEENGIRKYIENEYYNDLPKRQNLNLKNEMYFLSISDPFLQTIILYRGNFVWIDIEKKYNDLKKDIITEFYKFLLQNDKISNVKIENPTKIITFTAENKHFKLDLVEKREKKAWKSRFLKK